MGCGSGLGDLFCIADNLLQSPRPLAGSRWEFARPMDSTRSGEDLLTRLYKMHGEGQISEEVFTALRGLADRGQLRAVDLAVHQARTRPRPTRPKDIETENALRGIRSRLDQLAEARKGSEKILSELQGRIADVDGRISNKANAARGSVGEGDDQSARRRLTEKARLASSRDRLTRQLQLLKEGLAQLDDLTDQLQNKAIELEAVRARGDLASLGPVEGVQGEG
jgi:prefoldin subunit 5